jgi:hypothetical protein
MLVDIVMVLRELNAVSGLPDDDPRRQAALEQKRRMLDLVDEVEYEGLRD